MPFFLYICDMIKLEDYTIKQYAQMLKEQKGEQSDLVKEIDAELSSQLSNFGQGQNIGMFMLQKDMLILQCKLVLAIFDNDKTKEQSLTKRINKLREEIEKLVSKTNNKTPYKSFLSWILSVEKHLQFSINRDNDLAYLVEATLQMLTFYENQKAQIEQSKIKK